MLLNTSKASFFLAQGAKSLAVLDTKMGSAEIPCPNLLSLKMIFFFNLTWMSGPACTD